MIALRHPTLSSDLLHSAFEMMRLYETDSAHCERVEAYAQQIFSWMYAESDATPYSAAEDEAGLRTRLSLATLLHDIGHYIADKGHHRHSRYLVLSARQTQTWQTLLRSDVAALVFAHRKPAKRAWLNDYFDNRPTLFQLAAILRVADGLDRGRAGSVQLLSGTHRQRQFHLEAVGVSDFVAKHLTEKKADAWKWAFGHSLVLKTRLTP